MFNIAMIIDDTAEDLYITNRILSKNSFAKEVLQFAMADDALQYLRNNQENIDLLPEVIFVDIHMPGKSGFDFMAEFDNFSDAFKKNCKAYIISSTFDERDIAHAKSDKNVVDFQEKPITKQFLEGILNSTH